MIVFQIWNSTLSQRVARAFRWTQRRDFVVPVAMARPSDVLLGRSYLPRFWGPIVISKRKNGQFNGWYALVTEWTGASASALIITPSNSKPARWAFCVLFQNLIWPLWVIQLCCEHPRTFSWNFKANFSNPNYRVLYAQMTTVCIINEQNWRYLISLIQAP